MTDSEVSSISQEAPSTGATESRTETRHPALVVIMAANFMLSFSYQLWRSLFNNFAVGELSVRADQIGMIQSVREIPGLLGFTVGLLAVVLNEMRILGLSVVLLGAGIALTGSAGSLPGLLASTVLMSVGFHFFMPANSSVILQLTGEDEAPHVLGRLTSLNALAALSGAGLVFVALGPLGFRGLFAVTGVAVVVGGLIALLWSIRNPLLTQSEGDRQGLEAIHPVPSPSRRAGRTPMRRRYWLYYALEFLMGSRRHIFTTFAVLLLVRKYNVPAQTITVLYLVNNLVGTFVYRQFGRIIARFGERRTLTVNFLLLIFVFLGYAYIPVLPILYGLFLADQILFGVRIALQSYFQKIAVHPREITPNLSLGQTINHIAAVIIPLVGGIVWETVGSQYTFLVGVGIVCISLIVVQWMRVERGTASRAPAVTQ
jgi:predicted MFS family arabinose efflux permease